MKKIACLLTLCCLLVIRVSEQTTGDSSNTKTLQYLQGDGVYESGIMTFLKGAKDSIWVHFDLFITDAKALSAIFMIIFFAIKSYEMMAGDKQLEIMPLLKPFGLSMIILWWGPFTQMIALPTYMNCSKKVLESLGLHVLILSLIPNTRLYAARLILSASNE